MDIHDRQIFTPRYFERLEKVGVDRIMEQFKHYEQEARDLTLLCFENVSKSDWCHRLVFSKWWLERTGELIEELDEGEELMETEGSAIIQVEVDPTARNIRKVEHDLSQPKKKKGSLHKPLF